MEGVQIVLNFMRCEKLQIKTWTKRFLFPGSVEPRDELQCKNMHPW